MKTRVILGLVLLMSMAAGKAYAAYDHQYTHWQRVLRAYTHEGRVNYKALKENDREFNMALQAIEGLSETEIDSFDINQKKAFWINAYNIGVMKTILDNYPIKRGFGLKAIVSPASSIQQIPDVWNRPVLHAAGQDLSLNDIENKILRPQFKDPRIHFAIVCASIGCPVIRSEAYRAENLDQQLSDQIRLFARDPLKVRYDTIKGILYLSPIFKWFKEDFDQAGGAAAFVKEYMPAGITLSGDTKIQWLDYDWSLNERMSR